MAGWHTTGNVWSAVKWDPSGTQMTDLGKLPGFQSAMAKGINAAGTIVGYVLASGFAASRAFIWTASAGMQRLATLGGSGGIALSINDGGTAVGWASTPSGAIHAAKWLPNGTIVDINPAGAGYSEARSINEAGDIVGVAVILPKREHAYLWRHDGVQIDLGTLGGARSWANSVNNSLVIVGVSTRPAPLAEIAFGWTQATGMRQLSQWGPASEALGVSDLNRAVGKQTVNNGVVGLSQIRSAVSIDVLPDLAPAKGFPFSASTNVNRCGTAVGSSVSPQPTNGNSVPVVWRKATCD
jgi:probable HAF family extracellular repeat protein